MTTASPILIGCCASASVGNPAIMHNKQSDLRMRSLLVRVIQQVADQISPIFRHVVSMGISPTTRVQTACPTNEVVRQNAIATNMSRYFSASRKVEVVGEREHHRTHFRMRWLHVRDDAERSQRGSADGSDSRDHRLSVER